MNILIVDPDSVFAGGIRNRLAEAYHAIEVAETGTDAWMILATFKHRFDLVLLDLALPDIDGLDLLGRLRASPKHGDTPVVVCTSVNRRDSVARAIGYGISHYLIKPCEENAVCQKLLDLAGPACLAPK